MVARWPWLAAVILGLMIMVSSCVGGGMMFSDVVNLQKLTSAEDQKFLQSMAAHHEDEIEMCRRISEHGHSSGMQEMARGMLDGHGRQLDKMREMHRSMFGSELVPDETGHKPMDMPMMDSTMDGGADMPMMGGGGMPMIGGGKATEHSEHHPGTDGGSEVDRACLAQMIPHHQEAISMARTILGQTKSEEMMAFANELIADQTEQIETMRELEDHL